MPRHCISARPGGARSGRSVSFLTLFGGILALISVAAAFPADQDDPWKKVRDLKIGTEIRVIKAGAAVLNAQFAELTQDNLVVIVKNREVAIPRDKVARIDSRPQKGYVSTETTV